MCQLWTRALYYQAVVSYLLIQKLVKIEQMFSWIYWTFGSARLKFDLEQYQTLRMVSLPWTQTIYMND